LRFTEIDPKCAELKSQWRIDRALGKTSSKAVPDVMGKSWERISKTTRISYDPDNGITVEDLPQPPTTESTSSATKTIAPKPTTTTANTTAAVTATSTTTTTTTAVAPTETTVAPSFSPLSPRAFVVTMLNNPYFQHDYVLPEMVCNCGVWCRVFEWCFVVLFCCYSLCCACFSVHNYTSSR
jgi:hypothetical protein